MGIFEAIMVGIGIVVGLIVLIILIAFLIELTKAFIKMGKTNSDRADVNNGSHRDD